MTNNLRHFVPRHKRLITSVRRLRPATPLEAELEAARAECRHFHHEVAQRDMRKWRKRAQQLGLEVRGC